MKLESQVCSLELARRLKELGVKQDSQFAWEHNGGNLWRVGMPEISKAIGSKWEPFYSAFTVAELGEMLPFHTASHRVDGDPIYWICYERGPFARKDVQNQDGDTEADARAKMLIYLIENKLWSQQ